MKKTMELKLKRKEEMEETILEVQRMQMEEEIALEVQLKKERALEVHWTELLLSSKMGTVTEVSGS